MEKPRFQPGFRMSPIDGAVLVVGATAAGLSWSTSPSTGFVIAYVVGHFFLFCNVFRVARVPELVWAALFLALAVPTIALGQPGWPITISLLLAATVVIVCLEMRKPSYHGVGWKRLNPELPAWWNEQVPE